MSQIRIGDRVAPILNMHLVGEVVMIKTKSHSAMLSEGTLSHVRYALVKHDKGGNTLEYRLSELSKIDA